MGFKLPPINTLRLFEAAARLGSFRRAAEETHVTPSAVSHGVRTLEAWLGTALFQRGAQGLSLTPAGRSFAPQVHAALSILADAARRLPGRRTTGALSLSCAPTFARQWLIPRLSSFMALYPDLRLTLDTERHPVDFAADGIDLAIRRSRTPKSAGVWMPLIAETLVPVAAPALRREMPYTDDIGFLARAPHIHVTTVGEEWDAWFEAKGIRPLTPCRTLHVDTIQLAADSAIQGLGVAIGRTPLIDEDLRAGRLVEIAGPPVQAATRYWLVGLPPAFDRPEIKLFRAWILKELGADRRTASAGEA